MASNNNDKVYLQCVKENNKLRVKIISNGYNRDANCQFPRNIRVEGRRYEVPPSAIKVSKRAGTYYYHIKKSLIKNIDDISNIPAKIYALDDCCICLDAPCDIVIVDCGHLCMCEDCSNIYNKSNCPICRGNISSKINKAQLQ